MGDENGKDKETTKIEFTDEQQAWVNKLVGDARTKARSKAKSDLAEKTAKEKTDAEVKSLAAEKKWQELAERHEAKVGELEQFEIQAKAYSELIAGMLNDKIKALGEGAKKAITALPETLGDLEKLNWLNANESLFTTGPAGVGTPAAERLKQARNKSDDAREGHRRQRL